ncbi:unnamed protein product [Parnassius apollo]|uniref:Regulatory protein zeste n=1 Tax=Parnassius apollo TaxID=110799 RepID=A0A8S3W9C6_PARAO|nr:unnamed protein product [Parnassius apollo]
MDDEYKNDKTSVSHRSPTFSKEEIKALVDIIEKYKSIILNKSTSAAASHAKEVTWNKIAKMFNNQGFKYSRSADSLKTKWENLKKDARKLSKNLMDIKYSEFNDLTNQILSMMCEAEKSGNALEIPPILDYDLNDTDQKDKTNTSNTYWEDLDEKESDNSDGDVDAGRSNRSLNFSPQECSLLLKCVREEKKNIFCKESTGKAIQMKNSAWTRITDTFNKRSPQKRSTKVLRTKFNNMKRMAKNISSKQYLQSSCHKRLEDVNEKIKSEPIFEYKTDIDVTKNDDEEDSDDNNESNKQNNLDPLDTVLNGDSGIEPMSHFGSWSPSDSKDVVNFKLKLLNYQMETAKMERKRVEDALQAEAAAREASSLERSLRIRAARLEAVAAEMKFPSTHPALQYTLEESRAQQYLEQYNHT